MLAFIYFRNHSMFLLCFLFRTNRAVRCVLDRGDDMLIVGSRHPVLGRYKVQKLTLAFVSAR